MDSNDTSTLINGLLVEIHRSLLQYTAEAAPWAPDADAELQVQVMEFAAEQETSVKAIVEFLLSRKVVVDFGVYPQEYTSLHFVSLEYLLARLNESEQALLTELENALSSLAGDEEATNLIQSTIEQEQAVVEFLGKATLTTQSSSS